MHPTEIRLDRDRRRLSVTWENGATVRYPATLLRERARDAGQVRLEVDGWAVPAPADLTITSIEPIGNYAVRLGFSDGHDRGIFPWAFLNDMTAFNDMAASAGSPELPR